METLTTPFSKLEIQLIRSKLDTHSDGELAAIMDRSIEEIHLFIDRLTTGGADARSEMVQAEKEKQFQEAQAAKANKGKRHQGLSKNQKTKWNQETEERKKRIQKQNERRANSIEADNIRRKKELAGRAINRVYKTREVDLSKMHSLRVDKNTMVFYKDEEFEAWRGNTGASKKDYEKYILSRYGKTFDKKIDHLKTQIHGS